MSADIEQNDIQTLLERTNREDLHFQESFSLHQRQNTPVLLESFNQLLQNAEEEELAEEDPLTEKLSKTDPDEIIPLAELEKLAILRALKITQGNINVAAKKLGMGRATLYRRLALYEDIDVLSFKP